MVSPPISLAAAATASGFRPMMMTRAPCCFEFMRGGKADAAVAARDDRDFILQFHFRFA